MAWNVPGGEKMARTYRERPVRLAPKRLISARVDSVIHARQPAWQLQRLATGQFVAWDDRRKREGASIDWVPSQIRRSLEGGGTVTLAPIPEPTSAILFAAGIRVVERALRRRRAA
jgi:hypothetical protein